MQSIPSIQSHLGRLNRVDDRSEKPRSPLRRLGATAMASRVVGEGKENKIFRGRIGSNGPGSECSVEDVDHCHSMRVLNSKINSGSNSNKANEDLEDNRNDRNCNLKSRCNSSSPSMANPGSFMRSNVGHDSSQEEQELVRIYNNSEHRVQAEEEGMGSIESSAISGRSCIPSYHAPSLRKLHVISEPVQNLQVCKRPRYVDGFIVAQLLEDCKGKAAAGAREQCSRFQTGSSSAFQIFKSSRD